MNNANHRHSPLHQRLPRTSTRLAAVALAWIGLYILMTWPGQHDTWTQLAHHSDFAPHRLLLIVGTTALWAAPIVGLTATLHLASVARTSPSSAPHLPTVLAYLQTLTVTLVVVAENITAGVLLPNDTKASDGERWLILSLVASSAAATAGIRTLARIGTAPSHAPTPDQPTDIGGLKFAGPTIRAAGASALLAAPISYLDTATTPGPIAVAMFVLAVTIWIIAPRRW